MATVLIVDDEPDILLLVRINLELAGYEARTAADGEQALASVHEQRPDAIVLDVMMPKLDGWSVLERLKHDPDELVRTIPVVMLTALTSDQDEVRGGIEGAIRYLAKPVAPDALVGAVDDVLAGAPEPVRRKTVQQQSLQRLARMETGVAAAGRDEPRLRLSRLERPRSPGGAAATLVGQGRATSLTDKQRALLQTLQTAPSVTDAASTLGMSRSNIYASLRRVVRKLGLRDVSELLRRLRAGDLTSALDG
jgi:DNA-binding response OmpR family regulator